MTIKDTLLILSASATVFSVAPVYASLVDLGTAGTFNVYALGHFSSANSGVQGAAAAAGDFSATNYSINQKNKDGVSSKGYSLVVQGSLSYANGTIRHGLIYAGGDQSLTNVGLSGATSTNVLPFSFDDVSRDAISLSENLAELDGTGSTSVAYGGMSLMGSGNATTIFSVSGTDLSKVNYFNLSGLATNDTLIVNISGKDVTLQGGWNSFSGYNVLFNFYEAKSILLNGVGIYGSILAPHASVHMGSGSINGNVIVGDWNSSIALNASHYFVPTDIPSFAISSPIPEPRQIVLLLAGLGIVAASRVAAATRDSKHNN